MNESLVIIDESHKFSALWKWTEAGKIICCDCKCVLGQYHDMELHSSVDIS